MIARAAMALILLGAGWVSTTATAAPDLNPTIRPAPVLAQRADDFDAEAERARRFQERRRQATPPAASTPAASSPAASPPAAARPPAAERAARPAADRAGQDQARRDRARAAAAARAEQRREAARAAAARREAQRRAAARRAAREARVVEVDEEEEDDAPPQRIERAAPPARTAARPPASGADPRIRADCRAQRDRVGCECALRVGGRLFASSSGGLVWTYGSRDAARFVECRNAFAAGRDF